MLALGLLTIGVLTRVFAHAPNFTPVIALAFFGGAYLKKEQALWMPLAMMAVSDLVLGFHEMIFFTWGSVLLISLLGRAQSGNRRSARMLGMSAVSAVLFFVITNFGAWLAMYPLSIEGLVQCYAAAVPFFRNTLASTLLYSAVLSGAWELAARRVKDTRFEWITA